MSGLLPAVMLLGAWTSLPGPAGADCRCIDVCVQDPSVLLCCTWHGSHGGVFRSSDAGRSWLPVDGIARDHGYGMNVVRFCPADPQVALCGTRMMGSNGLYRSTDGGHHWNLTGYAGGYVNDIRFAPGARDTFYVISGVGLHRTTNAGASWTTLFEKGMCWRFGVKPGTGDTMFVGSYHGLYRSFDRGATWDTTAFPKRCYDFEFDPRAPDTLYVAGHVQGVYKVWDDGAAWDSLGNSDHYNTTIVVDSARRELWTGGFAFSPVSGRVSVGPGMGDTWRDFGPDRLYDPVCLDLCMVQGDTVLYAGGQYFGPQRFSRTDSVWIPSADGMREANVRAIACGGGVIYTAGSVMGVSRSDDGGQTWHTRLGTRVCGIAHNTEMLPPGLVCSSTDPDSVYATFQGHYPILQSVFASADGGVTWSETRVPGLEPNDRLFVLAMHPAGSETLLLATQGGAYRSRDAGQSWELVDSVPCYCVVFDPHDPSTVYSGWIGRMRRSTDRGTSWHDFSTGLPQWCEVMNIDPDPDSAGVLFAALCGGEARAPESGVYVYRSQAGRWARVSNGLPGAFVLRPRMVVDTVHSCLWCVLPNQGAQVYRSSDRGGTWQAADTGLTAYGAYFLYQGDRTYIGTRGDGLWAWDDGSGIRSGDGFETRAAPGATVFFTDEIVVNAGWVELFDHTGRMVGRGEGGLVTRDLASGVYFVRADGRLTKAVKPR